MSIMYSYDSNVAATVDYDHDKQNNDELDTKFNMCNVSKLLAIPAFLHLKDKLCLSDAVIEIVWLVQLIEQKYS